MRISNKNWTIVILVLYLMTASCKSNLKTNIEPEAMELDVQSGAAALYVRAAGDMDSNQVLIAIHGGPGNSSDYMLSLEDLKSKSLAVVNYDQRGTGKSSKPAQGYTLEDHAADLENIRIKLELEKINLFGHSWGGVVALRYATLYPEHVRSIILMGSGPPKYEISEAGQANLSRPIQQLQQDGIIPEKLPGSPQELIQTILPAYFSDPKFERPDELKNMSFDPDGAQRTLNETGKWDFSAALQDFRQPVLFLWGEDDPFGEIMAQGTLSYLTNAKVTAITFSSCGHYWQECEQDFLTEIRKFLTNLDAG